MTQQAGRELTMLDLAADYQWIRMLGWSDDDLRSVPVHEEAEAGGDMINLANFGETALGVGGGTSADTRSIPNLYVYESDTPANLWLQLKDLVEKGGPSAYNQMAGADNVPFPPGGSSS